MLNDKEKRIRTFTAIAMNLPKNTPKIIELNIDEYFQDRIEDTEEKEWDDLDLEDMQWSESEQYHNINNPKYIREDCIKEYLEGKL